jgi:small redox-active disulfide protein 2
MIIKILGTGCANCLRLEENTRTACKALKLDVQFIKVKTIPEIMTYNIMSLPALVVNEKVLSAGKVLKVDAIKERLLVESSVPSPTL